MLPGTISCGEGMSFVRHGNKEPQSRCLGKPRPRNPTKKARHRPRLDHQPRRLARHRHQKLQAAQGHRRRLACPGMRPAARIPMARGSRLIQPMFIILGFQERHQRRPLHRMQRQMQRRKQRPIRRGQRKCDAGISPAVLRRMFQVPAQSRDSGLAVASRLSRRRSLLRGVPRSRSLSQVNRSLSRMRSAKLLISWLVTTSRTSDGS